MGETAWGGCSAGTVSATSSRIKLTSRPVPSRSTRSGRAPSHPVSYHADLVPSQPDHILIQSRSHPNPKHLGGSVQQPEDHPDRAMPVGSPAELPHLCYLAGDCVGRVMHLRHVERLAAPRARLCCELVLSEARQCSCRGEVAASTGADLTARAHERFERIIATVSQGTNVASAPETETPVNGCPPQLYWLVEEVCAEAHCELLGLTQRLERPDDDKRRCAFGFYYAECDVSSAAVVHCRRVWEYSTPTINVECVKFVLMGSSSLSYGRSMLTYKLGTSIHHGGGKQTSTSARSAR